MDNEIYATEQLKKFREEKGLSQKEMSEFLSTITDKPISNSLYQKYEAGSENVPVNRALAIGKAINISFNELWEKSGGDDKKNQ